MPEVFRIDNEVSSVIVWNIEECEDWFLDKLELSLSEKLFLSSLNSSKRRIEWITSRYIVRRELGENISTSYIGNIPVIIGVDKQISISHSDYMVCVMICEDVCGVDIENSKRNFIKVASRFMSNEERLLIGQENYSLAWGVKEALYKLVRCDNIDFATMFTITKIDLNNRVINIRHNNRNYIFTYIKLGDYNIVYSDI